MEMTMVEDTISFPKKEITIIGPAVIDIMAGPVAPDIFQTGSQPMERIQFSFGGDALNEATVLARLGKSVELVTKIGIDDAGERILGFLKKEGIPMDSIIRESGLQTGMNVVLVDQKGERYFLTNPSGSLRKLSESDITPYLDHAADIVSFAGMFISPLIGIPEMERIFERMKRKPGRILAADMTKAKKGERIKDLNRVLPYIDYIFPNQEEIALLTGEKDPYTNAGLLIDAGVFCAVVKCGRDGCLVRTRKESLQIPPYPVKRAVDSTGAGDCFAAGFLWGLSQGLSLKECGYFASATASCTVEHMGATEGVCSLEEPMRRYQELWQ